MRTLIFMMIALPVIIYAGFGANTQKSPQKEVSSRGFIAIRDGRFIDPAGREIILHGANIVDKSREHNYLSWHGADEFAMMREWGFNCIRLGIIWDGVEPEPGHYDDKYLAGVDRRIQWAKENGIYVVFDMHQDLFSRKFGGDGAPDWAVLDDGKPHIHKSSLWSMAYFTSPAVQAAFDNFWANKPAPDGIGLQDHFAGAWRHVAERYADEPTVVGYDLFNEPFPGSAILQSMMVKVQDALNTLARKQGGEAPGVTDIMKAMSQSNDVMAYLDDPDIYMAFTDGGASLTREFESEVLSSFYNRVGAAIRQVDRNHILFMETHILCNAGTPSGIVPIVNQDGVRDALQALAPHGYDIVTDTDRIADASTERVDLIYQRHADTARRLAVPALVGEWGAFSGRPGTLPVAQIVVRRIEKHLFSDTYWSYGSSREMNNAPYFHVLARPYPASVSGTLIRCQSELESRAFDSVWRENPDITAPTRIYLPAEWFREGYRVDLEPEAEGWSFEPITEDSASGYLVIPPTGRGIERSLRLFAK